jgi:hypothetical protein
MPDPLSNSQMITIDQLTRFHDAGYVEIAEAIPLAQLDVVREAYEHVIEKALRLGYAPRDEKTGFLKAHRFQNPHHPNLALRPLLEAIATPALITFCQALYGTRLALHGVAAFAMQAEFNYCSDWHRDSYYAWGKDSSTERAKRELHALSSVQIMLPLYDDDSFWITPGSHNRSNTPEEEAMFEEKRVGQQDMFPGAIRLSVKAGTAVPFDARAIHRGFKPPGKARRTLFVVYGTVVESDDASIVNWARDPVYSDEKYLASLPEALAGAIRSVVERVHSKSK